MLSVKAELIVDRNYLKSIIVCLSMILTNDRSLIYIKIVYCFYLTLLAHVPMLINDRASIIDQEVSKMLRFPRCYPHTYLLLWLVLAWPSTALAQQSVIVGTVTDSTGAVLIGTNVTAKNVNTGEIRQASSNDVGQYAIPNLRAGTYEVSAERPGFQRQVVEQITLEVQLVRTVDLVLSPGEVSDQVTVTATTTPLQASESSVSTLFETKVVNEIPLNGRNFLQLQLLSPGVTMGRPSTFSAVKIDAQSTSIGGGGFSVNGMRDVYNDYLIDGVSFKDWIHGTNGMNPSVDSIQEFRTQTSNYPAEFGANAGGLVNMAIKSGTNQLHGTLYEFLRNDKLDAANFFTNRAGEEKPPLRRNQFGGTLGGPIRRDKTFFFASYEGFRERRTNTLFDTFPSAAMRNGDFSELLSLPDPTVIHDPVTGQPYPGNVIPANRVLSVMPDYLNTYVPLPNRPGLANNFVAPGKRSNDVDQFIGKFDQMLKSNLQLSGHYIFNDINDSPPTTNSNFFIEQKNRNQNVALHLTDTVSPETIVDLQFGYNLFKQFVNKNLAGTSPNIAADLLKINGVASDTRASDAPFFITSGFGSLGGFHFGPRQWFSERYEYQGSVSLVRGKHLIRAGLNAVRHHETFPEIFIGNGLYIFDGTFTGYSMADMLIGIPSGFQLSPELFDPQFRQWEIMPWIQDDWRITPKLTLNLGLRYEWRPWPVSKHDSISNIVLPSGAGQASLVLAGPCEPALPVRRCESSSRPRSRITAARWEPRTTTTSHPESGLPIGSGNQIAPYSAAVMGSSINRNPLISSSFLESIPLLSVSTIALTIRVTFRVGTGSIQRRDYQQAACNSRTFLRIHALRICRLGIWAFSVSWALGSCWM